MNLVTFLKKGGHRCNTRRRPFEACVCVSSMRYRHSADVSKSGKRELASSFRFVPIEKYSKIYIWQFIFRVWYIVGKDKIDKYSYTVEPLLTDTSRKRTPLVSGHCFWVPANTLLYYYIHNLS